MKKTSIYIGSTLSIGVLLMVLAPLHAFAQEPALGEVLSLEEDTADLQVNEATTTVSASAVPVSNEPWFSVEQLGGESVALGDFVVGPGRAELVVNPGQTATFLISVANRISDDRTFEITVEDVEGSSDASRSVVLLGEARGPYTIKDYITFPEKTFTLDLGERARIPVTISIPPDAEPGGFYGSVLISTVQTAEATTTESARSPIIARIGTLFFVTVPGEVEQSGILTDVSLRNNTWWYESGPITLSVLFENKGSVHLNPYGELRVKNLFGEEVGFMEIEPWFVLPKSLRTRDIEWNREILFGRYVATVSINRGYDDVVDTQTVVFWVMPWKIVGSVFIAIFLVMFALRTLFRNFEFKRKS